MAMFGNGQQRYEGLYPVLQQPADQSALEREAAPGAFEGDLGGAVSAGAQSAVTRARMALPTGNPTQQLFGIDLEIESGAYGEAAQRYAEEEKAYREKEAQRLAESLVALRPDPKTNGMASQILFGVTDVLGTVGLSSLTGRPALVSGGIYGYSRYREGVAEGLDPGTALAKGGIEGLAMGVSVALPAALTGGLAYRAATGAALNVGVGIPERLGVSTLLNAAGYPEMAQQYAPLDATILATEAILGAAFGGAFGARVRGAMAPDVEVPPSVVDAALVASDMRHVEIDTAPGIPIDTRSRQAHNAAMDSAVESLVLGRQVDVEALLRDAGFIGTRPDFDALKIIADELDRAGAGDLVAKVRALEGEARARGLLVDEDTLGGIVLSERPVDSSIARTAETEATPIRIGREVVPARMMLVEASEVQAAMRKAENQFRDRTRAASEQQISEIAARLDPGLLGDAPVMDYGAPVLSGDGRVIGGNGRVAAIARAYDMGSADTYRAAMRDQFGAVVDDMQRPMLVRVLQRDVDVAKAAMLSNEGGGLRMSALEQAKVDAERLGDFRAFEFGEDGALDLAANMAFIRQWAAEMPGNQRAALMDADGRLSAEGSARLRNAILYKAYGDSPTLARLVEATDPGSRNVAAALIRLSPIVADARDSIARGELHPIGLHDDLVTAVETLMRLRDENVSVDDWMRQLAMFGDDTTDEARMLVLFMDQNIRSARAMSDGISAYYDELVRLGDPHQGAIFETPAPDKLDMLSRAVDIPVERLTDLAASEAPMPKDPLETTTMPDARAVSEIAEADMAKAQELAKTFGVAVECFLRAGS